MIQPERQPENPWFLSPVLKNRTEVDKIQEYNSAEKFESLSARWAWMNSLILKLL